MFRSSILSDSVDANAATSISRKTVTGSVAAANARAAGDAARGTSQRASSAANGITPTYRSSSATCHSR
jgi:hypothetical protein